MTMRGMLSRAEIFPRLLAALLVLVLAPPTWAGEGEVSPALLRAAIDAYQQAQQQEPEILPPVRVDPKLVGKHVRVYYRDGRTLDGKLLELTPDFIRVETRDLFEQISLSEVARVKKRRSNLRRNAIYVGAAAAVAVVLVLLIGASRFDD